MRRPEIMVIGAVDSSGSSGITAACEVANSQGCRVRPVLTAAIARRASGELSAISAVPPRIVARQIDSICESGRPAVGLIGCLARHQTVDVVAERIRRRELTNLVLFPVVGESGGRAYLTDKGIKQVRRVLAGLCDLIVVDLASAAVLLNRPVAGVSQAAAELLKLGAKLVMVAKSPEPGAEAAVFASGQSGAVASVQVGKLGLESGAVSIVCRMAMGHDIVQAMEPLDS